MVLGLDDSVGGRALSGDVKLDENTLIVFHFDVRCVVELMMREEVELLR